MSKSLFSRPRTLKHSQNTNHSTHTLNLRIPTDMLNLDLHYRLHRKNPSEEPSIDLAASNTYSTVTLASSVNYLIVIPILSDAYGILGFNNTNTVHNKAATRPLRSDSSERASRWTLHDFHDHIIC